MAAAAIRCGAGPELAKAILDCITTEEAIEHLQKARMEQDCYQKIIERAQFYLQKRAGDTMDIQCMIYSSQYGLLGWTDKAEAFLQAAKEE